MAKNTSTPTPFVPGETNARAARGAPAVAQTPQRDSPAASEPAVDPAAAQTARTGTARKAGKAKAAKKSRRR